MKLLHVKKLLETMNSADAKIFGLFDARYLLTAVRIDSAEGFAEVHLGGDELLVIIEGEAIFTAQRDEEIRVHHIKGGDALWIEKGFEHQAQIIEPLSILALTPAEGNNSRAIDDRGKALMESHESETALPQVNAPFLVS
jgi:mannose-6-phosphate isomerase-like protein (cupin superfamily)